MAELRSGEREGQELDWESLQGPVPMDLIDPEFPAHLPQQMPGAASEILPREESEALAREAGAEIPSGTAADFPGDPDAGARPEADPEVHSTAHSAAHSASYPGSFPSAENPFMPPGYGQDPSSVDPRATIAGGTWFVGNQAQQDDFARIRAEMEAEDEAEKRRKQEAEQEEAAQRARLEQWMANARARLLKADADLTGPAGRIRLRKETSPSLHRLAEMQKTMDLSGEPTVPDGTRSLLTAPAPDPMATISVPADQFLKLDPATANGPAGFPPLRPYPAGVPAPAPAGAYHAPAAPAHEAQPAEPTLAFPVHPFVRPAPASHPPTGKFAARPIPPERSDYPGAMDGPQESALGGNDAPPANSLERSLAFPPDAGPSGYSEGTAFRPMTREEALTRKVAKLRIAAEGGDNTLVRSPLLDEEHDGRALNFAIAAMVLIAILVLGLGLFAATQAGLFDGLENRIPFLKPKVAMGDLTVPDQARRGAVANPVPAAPRSPAPASDVVEAPAEPAASRATASAAGPSAPAAAPAPASAAEARSGRIPAARAAAPPARPAESASRNIPATPRAARAQARPAQAEPSPVPRPARTRKGQAQSFPPSPPEEEIPAYARPRASSAAQSEMLLRNAVESAANQEKDDLRELYNRYALGFPGLSGEVVVGLTVDPSGRILEATVVSSTTGVTTFDQDLVRKVVLWRLRSFPETRPKFISVPFLFPMQGH